MSDFTSPDELIAAFGYQFPEDTAGKVVFCKSTFEIFSGLCQQIDAALGDDKRGFHWTDTRGGRFKFHVTPGIRSSDVAALCHAAKGLAGAVEQSGDATYTNELLSVKWWAPQSSSILNPEQLMAALPYM
ncbi:MAG: hypothetical protein HXX19_09625, partial [Rhodoferax sp.]|nr:hypothetical protein [Rhodoferax sp.]